MKKYCNFCNKKIGKYIKSGLCASCSHKIYFKSNKCKDCGKNILRVSERCRSCSIREQHKYRDTFGENNSNWKGRCEKLCKICGKEFSVHLHRKNIAKCCSTSCARIYTGFLNKTGRTYIKKTCAFCENKIEKVPANIKNTKLSFCNSVCYGEWLSKNKSGKNANRWLGGHDNYYGPNWLQQRKLTINRDENICQLCGITSEEIGKNMDVHHIIPFRLFDNNIKDNNYLQANDLNNLECLCHKCHMKNENEFRIVEKMVNKKL